PPTPPGRGPRPPGALRATSQPPRVDSKLSTLVPGVIATCAPAAPTPPPPSISTAAPSTRIRSGDSASPVTINRGVAAAGAATATAAMRAWAILGTPPWYGRAAGESTHQFALRFALLSSLDGAPRLSCRRLGDARARHRNGPRSDRACVRAGGAA